MSSSSLLPGEVTELYSPIGLLPIDAFTGRAPIGRVNAFLDAQDDNGDWRATGIHGVRTPGEIIAYPGLQRRVAVAGQPPRQYRVRLEAEFYQPLYRLNADGIEFPAHPYNDANPPADYPKTPDEFPAYLQAVLRKVWLAPAPNYPFPDHILVLRGDVKDAAGEPVVEAEVFWGNKETTLTIGPPASSENKGMVLTASRGVFALPLRVTEKEHTTEKQTIDAVDHRTGLSGNIEIDIPEDLGKNNTITIS
jgi:hypothetical protein